MVVTKINQEQYDALILQMPMKPHPSSDIGNQSCCRLCGSVKDVAYCKNPLKKANEELLCMEDLRLI